MARGSSRAWSAAAAHGPVQHVVLLRGFGGHALALPPTAVCPGPLPKHPTSATLTPGRPTLPLPHPSPLPAPRPPPPPPPPPHAGTLAHHTPSRVQAPAVSVIHGSPRFMRTTHGPPPQVNNAAVQHYRTSITELKDEDVVATFETNILGMFYMAMVGGGLGPWGPAWPWWVGPWGPCGHGGCQGGPASLLGSGGKRGVWSRLL